MGENTAIPWTDSTVNFWWGCTKVGPGCEFCYAEQWDRRTGGAHWGVGVPRRKIASARKSMLSMQNVASEWAADYECAVSNALAFGMPAPIFGPRRRVFVQSMSDLFDLEVPIEWFVDAWLAIHACDGLAIQIVTKRVTAIEKRMRMMSWPKHAGLIITVVDQQEADRDVPRALALKAKLGIPWLGLSIEPQIGPIILKPEWLGGNDEVEAQRGICSSGGSERGFGGSTRRHDLAPPKAGMGPLATEGGQSPVQAGTGGAPIWKISSGYGDDRRQEGLRLGSPADLVSLQGTDSGRPDRQSQGREEEAQQTDEPRTGDLFGATGPCLPDSRNRQGSESERRGQSPHEDDQPAGSGNSTATIERREAPANRGRLRDRDAGGIEDRARRPLGVSWIISGGESKQGKDHEPRPYDLAWARSLRDQCAAAGVAYFQKQLGARPMEMIGPNQMGHMLKDRRAGADPAEWPADLRVQQFPEALLR